MSVGKNLATTIKQQNKSIKMFIDKIPRYQNNLILTPITISEIRKITNKLKSSSGHDIIGNILLKEIPSNIMCPLHYIFNKSIDTADFPDSVKLAEIVPLFKNKERFSLKLPTYISTDNNIKGARKMSI